MNVAYKIMHVAVRAEQNCSSMLYTHVETGPLLCTLDYLHVCIAQHLFVSLFIFLRWLNKEFKALDANNSSRYGSIGVLEWVYERISLCMNECM